MSKLWTPGMTLEDYAALWQDMAPHIDTLRDNAFWADRIVEMGVRGGVSTWALLDGWTTSEEGHLISIDIDPNVLSMVPEPVAKDPRWTFIRADTTNLELRTFADLVLIDTSHEYRATQIELRVAAAMDPTTILLHDYLDPAYPGVQKAVDEFVADSTDGWTLTVEESPWGLAVLNR